MMPQKILIANRGEIARRIIRTAKRMGFLTVALYTPDEQLAPWVSEADEAVNLGEGTLADTYLNPLRIVDIATKSGCWAVHPGYGFLSENKTFAKACTEARLVFIGPKPEVIDLMGNKLKARKFASDCGVPVAKSWQGTHHDITERIAEITYPVIVKAAAGGGGKGMHIVNSSDELVQALEKAATQASQWFGSNEVYLEQYLNHARHIEVQVLADNFGHTLHLFERECSLQRHYQKIIEEAPSVSLNPEQRNAITQAAVELTKKSGYSGAGTIEFLWQDGQFYFLEMNTRIQVEHPVTECITGIDIVEQQLLIAQNKPLSLTQSEIKMNGHAIEARLYCENPEHQFKPTGGSLNALYFPKNHNIRIESAYTKPIELSNQFDGLITKIISHSANRQLAIENLKNALAQTVVHGTEHNGQFLQTILSDQNYMANHVDTNFIETHLPDLLMQMNQTKSELDQNVLTMAFAAVYFHGIGHRESDTNWHKVQKLSTITQLHLSIDNEPKTIWVKKQQNQIIVIQDVDRLVGTLEYMDDHNIILTINQNRVELYYSYGERWLNFQFNGIVFKILSQNMAGYARLTDKVSEVKLNGLSKISSPLFGKIAGLLVNVGESVKQGQVLLNIESMKTLNEITSPVNGKVESVLIFESENIKENQLLLTIQS